MYNLPFVPPPIHTRRVRVEEAKLDEVFHNVEEVPPMTQTQNQTGYGTPMMMPPTFGARYCDYEVSNENYDSGISPLSSYMDVDPSTSYMHGHGHGHGEHNEYVL